MRRITRRTFLAATAGAALAACSPGGGSSGGPQPDGGNLDEQPSPTLTATPEPTSTQTPTATPHPMGVVERTLLPGTQSETRVVIRHSGREGPVAVVLGGVHGNEPGGWLAADEVATWEPSAGSLIVIPRANVQAIARYVRTTNEIGDLNRLYPGSPESPLLMERMAAEILAVCREFEATLLLDMHESWAFYAEYAPGSGALGQTITSGTGPLQATLPREMAARVNPHLTQREQMIVRDRSTPPGATPGPERPGRSRSSLAAGAHVPGLTAILVEMGHENSPEARRVKMHLLTARAALEVVGVLA